MTNGADAIRTADEEARRRRWSPAAINTRELRAGHRWTLLQAIAWIATESDAYVKQTGDELPHDNALPAAEAAMTARLKMNHMLRELKSPALSFPLAQSHLLKMINEGAVVLYVDHVEYVPAGHAFSGISYTSDYTGLLPAPDDRYWGYVVTDAESVRQGWEIRKPTPFAAANEAAQPRLPRRSDRTGGPGAPSSMHIIDDLLSQEASAGNLLETLAAQARELRRLFDADALNDGLRKPEPGTIENRIRSEYKRLKREACTPHK